ncbi:MAG TPA: BamA/TamA family outer membrane protein [Bacteroidales bacterium]|nr:BamA/TamA family outer membrane protein [Bacteroidales bacterium]
MKNKLLFLTAILGIILLPKVRAEEPAADTLQKIKADKIKTGWTFGAVPAIAFDSDVGFKYGGVVNLYYFGDGSTYPKYLHSIYLEWSRTTKGSGINQFIYDSKHLIPGIRVMAEASLLTEKALDFYGFNGYNSFYNPAFETDNSAAYISRMYYRQDRKLTRIKADFIGDIKGTSLKWLAGIAYFHNKIGTVDIATLNKGKSTDDLLPDTSLLYDQYVNWGIIPQDQKDGGTTNLLKAGLVYDTRDNEPNPMKGMWTDLQLLLAPGFMGNDYAYTRLALTQRQYFTLVPKRLSLAYRLSYQAKLSGEMPFYMLPFVFNSAPNLTRDGLGGAKTIRGVLRNRIVGEDFVYGNIETRWKFYKNVILNQNVYLALSAFLDGGMVTGKYKLDLSGVPADEMYLFNADKEALHLGYGAGLHVALNENFVLAIDYGRAADPRDGDSGLYIGLNFLF